MRGLPAPVVRRAVERIVRDLRKREQQKDVGGGQQEEPSVVVDERADGGDASYGAHEGKGSDGAGDGNDKPGENGPKEGVSCGEEAGTTRSGIGLDGAKESLGAAPCLPLQLVTVELSKARAGLGLSETWSRKVEDKCRDRQKQVRLSRVVRRHFIMLFLLYRFEKCKVFIMYEPDWCRGCGTLLVGSRGSTLHGRHPGIFGY